MSRGARKGGRRVGATGLIRPRRLLLPALLLSAFAAPGTAQAAFYDDACAQDLQTPVRIGADDRVRQMIAAGESALATSLASRGDDALRALANAAPDAAASPNRADLVARYCLTAGEAMRVARGGSDREAKLLLVGAYKRAEQAGDASLAARAAFQIGLTAASESSSGAGAGLRAAADDVGKATTEVMRACAPTIADVVSQQADFFTAAAALECAAATAEATGDHQVAASSSLRLGRLNLAYAGRDRLIEQLLLRDGEERLFVAIDQGMRIADPEVRAEITLRAIESLLARNPQEPRVAAAIEALKPTTAGRPGLEAYRLAMAARLAGATGKPAEQRALLSRAIFTEVQQSQPLRLATWYLDLAEADPARRGEHVAAAYRALESVRPLLPQFDPITQESTFQLRMRAVFEKAAEFQLTRDASDRDSIARAQSIIERYRQAELQNVFGSECIAAREPLRPTDLAAGEMVLYPVLLPDRIELLYATGGSGGFQRLTVSDNAGRADVAALVQTFVAAASNGNDGWREPARRLHQLLVAPVLAQAGAVNTIIVVPDGPLRSVPFAALLDGSDKYLVETARVVAAPALGYAEPGDAAKPAPSVLALSLAKEVALPAGLFPKLEGTTEEARAAAGSTGLLIQDFRKADLEQALGSRPVDILHLSTHASFNGRADRAFIVADGEAIRLGELRELIADNQARGDMLNLLVLGACETAVGDDQASMGLAGAAVQAGARSAVASLWQVNDLGTVALMRAFYDNMRQGKSKAEALQLAQLSLIRSGPEFANPNIWSAFILLGGWR